jgi:hypothetical protein
MMGLEPTTFGMARVSNVRAGPGTFAQAARLRRFRSSRERTRNSRARCAALIRKRKSAPGTPSPFANLYL